MLVYNSNESSWWVEQGSVKNFDVLQKLFELLAKIIFAETCLCKTWKLEYLKIYSTDFDKQDLKQKYLMILFHFITLAEEKDME